MPRDTEKPKSAWRHFLTYLLIFILCFIMSGFVWFANKVSKLAPPAPVPIADGIVVWTGKGGDRLQAAGQLLNEGHGERLLISGVNEALSEEDVYRLLNVNTDKGLCCTDIDYKAQDTIDNARETHQWLTSLGYEHIILVTSAYHMPRAQTEISALSGRVRITPYPVTEKSSGPWWKDKTQIKRLIREYGKLLLTNLRQIGNDKQRQAPELTEIPNVGP